MGPRWRRSALAVGALLLMLGTVRVCTATQEQRRREESDRAVAELRDRLASATPESARVAISPAPPAPRPTGSGVPTRAPESHEGWVVESVTAWCGGGYWAGEANVRATTESPRTWGFVVTLTDGRRDLAELRGEHDHMAYMDAGPVRLTSTAPCPVSAPPPVTYRWTVAP